MIGLFAHAWWSAFVFASGAPLGALALRLIGRLTGGRWTRAKPLARLSALTPWLCLFALPGLVLTPWIFPAAPPGIAAYLAAPAHAARMALALIGWSLIAIGMTRFRGRLFAALALVFHGIAVSLVSVDWIMALAPGWISSAGGMSLADQQFALALAVTLAGLAGEADQGLRKDIAGLLAAMLLANLYFALMTYVVPWYGDLASKTAWFRLRADPAWRALLMAALALGSIAPLVLLGLGRRRAAAVRAAGFVAIAGLALQSLWWSTPAPDASSLAPAALLVAIAGAGLVLLGGAWRPAIGGRLAHVR